MTLSFLQQDKYTVWGSSSLQCKAPSSAGCSNCMLCHGAGAVSASSCHRHTGWNFPAALLSYSSKAHHLKKVLFQLASNKKQGNYLPKEEVGAGPCRGEVVCLLFLDHRVHFRCSILRRTWKMSKNHVRPTPIYSPSAVVTKDHHIGCSGLRATL